MFNYLTTPITFSLLTTNYINDMMFLWPITLQQMNPLESMIITTLMSMSMSMMVLMMKLLICNMSKNTKLEMMWYGLTNNMILIILIKIMFLLSKMMLLQSNKIINTPHTLTHMTLTSFYYFNMLMMLMLLAFMIQIKLQILNRLMYCPMICLMIIISMNPMLLLKISMISLILIETPILTHNMNKNYYSMLK